MGLHCNRTQLIKVLDFDGQIRYQLLGKKCEAGTSAFHAHSRDLSIALSSYVVAFLEFKWAVSGTSSKRAARSSGFAKHAASIRSISAA